MRCGNEVQGDDGMSERIDPTKAVTVVLSDGREVTVTGLLSVRVQRGEVDAVRALVEEDLTKADKFREREER
jgi:hypothetical protein